MNRKKIEKRIELLKTKLQKSKQDINANISVKYVENLNDRILIECEIERLKIDLEMLNDTNE